MDTPFGSGGSPGSTYPIKPVNSADSQIRAWLKLRRELSELHAQLEYLKLMLTLGVHRGDD